MKEEPGFTQKHSTNNTIYFYQQPVIANQRHSNDSTLLTRRLSPRVIQDDYYDGFVLCLQRL